MKKYLASILGFLMVFGFMGVVKIAPAQAAVESLRGTEVKLGGDIRIRHEYQDGIEIRHEYRDGVRIRSYAVPSQDVRGGSAFDQRMRLDLRIDAGDGVTGRILTEIPNRNQRWGQEAFGGGYIEINKKRVGLRDGIRVRQAWIAYETDIGVPAAVKLGLQPMKIGKGWLVDGDATGIVFQVEPAEGTNLFFVYASIVERGKTRIDTGDLNLYSLMATHTVDMGGDLTFGANYTLVTTDGGGMARDGRGNHRSNGSNFGLFVEGEFGGLGLHASADFQFGSLETINEPDLDFKGRAYTIGAEYSLNAAASVRAGFGLGSGEERAYGDNEVNIFVPVRADDLLFIYDDKIGGAGEGGISNTTFFNIGATVNPTDRMTIAADIHLLKATEVVEANRDDNIGTEISGTFTYNITGNLTYTLQAGVLFAGDFYKLNGVDPDNVVAVTNALVLRF